ncbi:MAG: hypothetical protein J0I84_08270 [Terrimonas sp.]|nr:hypothetical protein [Terrimonas sp.]
MPNINVAHKDNTTPTTNTEKPTTIHIVVALCDNQYQGIVKVAPAIGNGQQPATNLYWGAAYGIKTYFSRKQSDWQLLQMQQHVSDTILERLIFKHKAKNAYLMADAYDGRYIKSATENLLQYSSGGNVVTATIDHKSLLFGGLSDIICYSGHDGLMDFSINKKFLKKNDKHRSAIILACHSKRFFSPHLINTGAEPLLWSTGLMAPEAYILHSALAAKLNKENEDSVCESAAKAYAQYQKCSVNAAKKLLVTGW